MKDARIFLGHERKTEGFWGLRKGTKGFFWVC